MYCILDISVIVSSCNWWVNELGSDVHGLGARIVEDRKTMMCITGARVEGQCHVVQGIWAESTHVQLRLNDIGNDVQYRCKGLGV